METLETLWSSDLAAKHLRVKPETLANWRSQGKGPSYVKIGRLVGYRPEAIDAYLNRHTIKTYDSS